jgi:hypothetical protein
MRNGKGGAGLVREERLQIMLSPEELKAVDNFRFFHRLPSRAAAVRELLRHGLGAVGSGFRECGSQIERLRRAESTEGGSRPQFLEFRGSQARLCGIVQGSMTAQHPIDGSEETVRRDCGRVVFSVEGNECGA